MKRLISTHSSKRRAVRHARVRSRVSGTALCPRLSVHRALKSITAQLIDDVKGETLVYVNSRQLGPTKIEGKTTKVAAAFMTGKKLGELATAKKITKVVFDRGGYNYHGRVAAVAEGARGAGLQF